MRPMHKLVTYISIVAKKRYLKSFEIYRVIDRIEARSLDGLSKLTQDETHEHEETKVIRLKRGVLCLE